MASHSPRAFCAIALTIGFLSSSLLFPQGVAAQDREPRADEPAKVAAGEKVFSGPQAGEALPELPVWVTSADDKPSTKVDLSELSTKSPVAIIFMHEKSRPAFQLAKVMSAFIEQKKESKLQFYVVVLTDDRSASEKWLGQIRRYLSEQTHFSVADGGIEGPGALGLNRLVALTVVIAKDQKVTANFALTQVTAATDGPPILKAMNEVSGGGEIPKIEDLLPQQARRQPPR